MLALVLVTGGVAGAQEEDGRQAEDKAAKYRGVAPGDGGPDGRKPRQGRTPMVTWLGFQPQIGGGARVFVQLDREVPLAQVVQAGAVVISLAGARAERSSTGRFLDTRFFDTPVERIAIEPARRRPGQPRRAPGLELVIRFKDPAQARELATSMNAGKDGYTYLLVDLPASGSRIGSREE